MSSGDLLRADGGKRLEVRQHRNRNGGNSYCLEHLLTQRGREHPQFWPTKDDQNLGHKGRQSHEWLE